MLSTSSDSSSAPTGGRSDPPRADPRPRTEENSGRWLLQGARCADCSYAMVIVPPVCPACGCSNVLPTEFGPGGVVFSSTVLRIPIANRPAPTAFAYIDIDDGPRILAKVPSADRPLLPGTRVALIGPNRFGDPCVTVGP
jgi:uncharacterized OB-fold protein